MTTATATARLNVDCERCGVALSVPASWVFDGRVVTCADLERRCSALSKPQHVSWAPPGPVWTWVAGPAVMLRRPPTRVCRLCGEEFVQVGNETYCCPNHRKLSVQFRLRHAEIRRCVWCRTEFVWVKRGRTSGRYCQRACLHRGLARMMRGPRAKRGPPNPRQPCAGCGIRLSQPRLRTGSRYCSRRCAAAIQRFYSASHLAEGQPISIKAALRRLHAAGIYTSQPTLIHWLHIRVLPGEYGHGRRSVSDAALDDLIADILSNPLSPRNRTGAAA